MKKNALDMSFDELKFYMESAGEKSFRARQIFKSLHRGLDFSEMTDIPKTGYELLSEEDVEKEIASKEREEKNINGEQK